MKDIKYSTELGEQIIEILKENKCYSENDINRIKEDNVSSALSEIVSLVNSQNRIIKRMQKQEQKSESEKRAEQRKLGFYLYIPRLRKDGSAIYYVQYRKEKDDGTFYSELYPSKWSTNETDYTKAFEFAVNNRNRILNRYKASAVSDMERYLLNYYSPEGTWLKDSRKTALNNYQRTKYYGYMKNYFVPFFNDPENFANGKKRSNLMDITSGDILTYVDYMLADGYASKTIKTSLSALRRPFERLQQEGSISNNPLNQKIILQNQNTNDRSCIEPAKTIGVFNKSWQDDWNYIICLVAFSTGMRNSEIKKLRYTDIIEKGNIKYFGLLFEGKTENSKRYIPIHPFVYEKIVEWKTKQNISDDDLLFHISGKQSSRRYRSAVQEFGSYCGYTADMLDNENITFYGFRHSYQTILDLSPEVKSEWSFYFTGHKQDQLTYKYDHLSETEQASELAVMAEPVLKTLNKYLIVE